MEFANASWVMRVVALSAVAQRGSVAASRSEADLEGGHEGVTTPVITAPATLLLAVSMAPMLWIAAIGQSWSYCFETLKFHGRVKPCGHHSDI